MRDGGDPIGIISLDEGKERSQPAMAMFSREKVQQMQIFLVRCAFHEWEQSRIATLREPHFALTDLEGRFAISNVPPSAYAVELSHPATFGTSRQFRNITLHAGATETVTYRIHPKR